MTFTITAENNITAHASAKQGAAVEGAEIFRNEAGLAKLAGNWPIARLVEIWNSLPGVSPVKKFKDRPTGVARIWKAIQDLDLAAPALAEPVAEEAVTSEATAEPAVATRAHAGPGRRTHDRAGKATVARRCARGSPGDQEGQPG